MFRPNYPQAKTYTQQSDRIQNLNPEIDEIDVYVC